MGTQAWSWIPQRQPILLSTVAFAALSVLSSVTEYILFSGLRLSKALVGILLVLLAGEVVLKYTGQLVLASPAGLFYVITISFVYIGTLLIYFGETLSYAKPVVAHPIVIAGAIFMFSAGVAAASYFLKFNANTETARFVRSKLIDGLRGGYTRIPLYAIMLVLVAWVASLYITMGSPLLSGVNYRDWAHAAGWRLVALQLLIPLTALLIFFREQGQSQARTVLVGVVLGSVVLIPMILTSRRYFVLDLLIWLFVLYNFLSGEGYRRKITALVGLGVIAVPFFLLVVLIRTDGIGSGGTLSIGVHLWTLIEHRIFLSEATGVNYILTHYPTDFAYLGPELYFNQFESLIPGVAIRFSLGEWLFNHALSSGGYLPPTILGQLYASFGLFGFAGMFIWGAILQVIFVAVVRVRKSVVSIVFAAVVFGYLGRSIILGMFTTTNQVKYIAAFIIGVVAIQYVVRDVSARVVQYEA